MSKKASSITSRNSASNALNGLKKRQSHLICNWLPLSSFHHQFLERSLFSRNEPGNTGLHNGIKPYSRLDSIADLPHGVFRNGGNIKVLEDAAGRLRGGQGSRPALDSPGEQHLGRGLLDSLGDSSDDRVFQQIGLAAMAQGSESL